MVKGAKDMRGENSSGAPIGKALPNFVSADLNLCAPQASVMIARLGVVHKFWRAMAPGLAIESWGMSSMRR